MTTIKAVVVSLFWLIYFVGCVHTTDRVCTDMEKAERQAGINPPRYNEFVLYCIGVGVFWPALISIEFFSEPKP